MSSAPLRRRAAPDASGRDEAFWAAILARDPSFDGRFFYSVASTGIYCRPTCAARRPKRGHVSFHATAEAAERAGFRPCKRCKPKETSPAQERAARVSAACRLIEAADQPPSLGTLAAAVDLSPHHFHRVFKATLGITPKAYAAAHRRKRLRGELGQSATITAAIYGAGFNSSSRFYATSSEALGMTPTQFRQGAPDATIAFAIGQCSLGAILVAASAEGVCAVLFGDNAETLRRDLARQFPRAHLAEGDKDYRQLMAKVIALVEDPREDPDLPLDIRGTAFQHRVWDALRRIPLGATASYAEIAKAIGAPGSARAVARACASNRIAVAIPCHRVVASDGSLSGYRGGVERKRALLAREAKSKPSG